MAISGGRKILKLKVKPRVQLRAQLRVKLNQPIRVLTLLIQDRCGRKHWGYLFNGKTTYLDADKPLYIRIAPEYYTRHEYDDEPWVVDKDFKFTKKNRPSNKYIVKFYKKFMLNKKSDLMEYLGLTHFKLIDVYTVGNKIEYKFKCVACIDPTNGHILTPDRTATTGEAFLSLERFARLQTDGLYKWTTAGEHMKFMKIDKQQVHVRLWRAGAVTTYQK
jgi:hypothetical protein